MKNKFNLTVDENIFVAKRNIVDYIWKSAKLEGLSVDFPETDAIYNGFCAANIKVEDVLAVNNLKHSWHFLFHTVDYDTDFAYICALNKIVCGNNLIYGTNHIRTIPVHIGGTTWTPDIPYEQDIKENIKKILTIESPTERAITLMLYCMRTQMFIDGNKRTSMLAGNHEMIKNGCGIISVPIEHQIEFMRLLINFYETNQMDEIKQFVYENCVDGLDLRKQEMDNKKADENKKIKD